MKHVCAKGPQLSVAQLSAKPASFEYRRDRCSALSSRKRSEHGKNVTVHTVLAGSRVCSARNAYAQRCANLASVSLGVPARQANAQTAACGTTEWTSKFGCMSTACCHAATIPRASARAACKAALCVCAT